MVSSLTHILHAESNPNSLNYSGEPMKRFNYFTYYFKPKITNQRTTKILIIYTIRIC